MCVSGASGAEGEVLQRLHPGSGNPLVSCHRVHRGTRRKVTTKFVFSHVSLGDAQLVRPQAPGSSHRLEARQPRSRLECSCPPSERPGYVFMVSVMIL